MIYGTMDRDGRGVGAKVIVSPPGYDAGAPSPDPETAMREADHDDVEGTPQRSPQRRRADALVDVCRWFLENHHHPSANRHRPNIDVVIDLDDLPNMLGRLRDGTPLDRTTMQRLLCDAGIHRYIADGRSTVLDYGMTTRTVSAPLWNAHLCLPY